MKLLIDTNIVLDVILERNEYLDSSASVLKLAGISNVYEYITASSITDVYYIAYKQLKDIAKTKQCIRNILQILDVADVGKNEILNALDSDWKDFEDAVQYSTAIFADFDGIVTRNLKDFSESLIPVYTPEEILLKFR